MIEELSNRTFRSAIGNPARSTLVQYYSPTCAACRPAHVMFRASAEAFKPHSGSLAFCAMDISRNACPTGIYVPGTPCIQLYVRGDSRRKTYQGELEAAVFNRFIEAELGLKLEASGGDTPPPQR